ncbi:DsrE family protein [Enterococcus asini]|uniref:DsrE family protein n=1 Tax=Enterococcus TaxID=1350 RepID=UPI00288E779B|nr:DsrE family protein [Enterococcus asini]MDT2755949.1 DsrE family protein [Enterococcus asini]
MKVVFHVDEVAKWSEAKKNIHNLKVASPTMQIVLLINGAAITGLLDPEQQEFIETGEAEIHACRNALRGFKIEEERLPAKVTVVPAGVLDLVKLQHLGYAYIKP